MKISPISNTYNFYGKKLKNKKQSAPLSNNENSSKTEKGKNAVSFKSIYLENIVDLGMVSQQTAAPKFLKKDALLLNEIAQDYPNQDCFIRKGYGGYPYLEYREKPVDVQLFNSAIYNRYTTSIDPADDECPVEPLIIYPDSRYNIFIGLNSFISLNPSLAYTIKAGFEVHKKLLEKKMQIMETIGRTDPVDLGDESVTKKAHKAIEDVEIAVIRYLLESAYAAVSDRASAQQIYESNYPKVQSRLDAKRKLDLVTSTAKRPEVNLEKLDSEKVHICELAMRNFPNVDENKARIEELTRYMSMKGMSIG